MSYDISIIKSCTCGEYQKEIYSDNYTSNVGEMYQRAFNNELGIKILHELPIQMAIVFLSHAIDYMNIYQTELEKLNPSNGWGCFKGAKEVLENLLYECTDLNLKGTDNCKIEIGW